MNEDVRKKVEFILAWFNQDRHTFNFSKQVKLAKIWIVICTTNEEYEMASALQKELQKIIEGYLKKKRFNRSWKARARYYWIKLKRKFRRI